MKIKYENIEDKGLFYYEPLTYRLSISCIDVKIIIKREYFRVGYKTGEKFDEFFRDDYLMHPMVSIITRNFNEKYLNELENKIIDEYINFLNFINDKMNKQKQTYNIQIDNKVNQNNNLIKFISSKNRIEKITKLFNDK